MSKFRHFNMLTCQLANMSTHQLVNLSTYHLLNMSTSQYINFSICQLVNLSALTSASWSLFYHPTTLKKVWMRCGVCVNGGDSKYWWLSKSSPLVIYCFPTNPASGINPTFILILELVSFKSQKFAAFFLIKFLFLLFWRKVAKIQKKANRDEEW